MIDLSVLHIMILVCSMINVALWVVFVFIAYIIYKLVMGYGSGLVLQSATEDLENKTGPGENMYDEAWDGDPVVSQRINTKNGVEI
jgi:hypothetical protein